MSSTFICSVLDGVRRLDAVSSKFGMDTRKVPVSCFLLEVVARGMYLDCLGHLRAGPLRDRLFAFVF